MRSIARYFTAYPMTNMILKEAEKMADRVWTAGQSAAINMREGDLIISAAAGSGKTAVLCERVIRSLLDEKEPINISDMLMVFLQHSV